MTTHHDLTDAAFENQFTTLTLDPTLFSHEAHLRLAWIHIRRYGIEKAIENMCEQIQRFATHHGDSGKFNITLTVAATRAVYHFALRSTTNTFKDFIAENNRLLTEFKQLLSSHYATNIFTSDQARKSYLEPDLLPFD